LPSRLSRVFITSSAAAWFCPIPGSSGKTGSLVQPQPDHLLALAPGKQPFHTLNPAAARLNDGRVMVYGSMGGDGQPQTQAALFTRYVVQGVPLQESITRPRWLLGRTWGQTSDTLKLEGRFSSDTRPFKRAGPRRGNIPGL
jgi:gamma-glutamyltranspeptidase